MLISDNVHGGEEFADFCRSRGLTPRVFLERPRGYFYPGAGIGCVGTYFFLVALGAIQ